MDGWNGWCIVRFGLTGNSLTGLTSVIFSLIHSLFFFLSFFYCRVIMDGWIGEKQKTASTIIIIEQLLRSSREFIHTLLTGHFFRETWGGNIILFHGSLAVRGPLWNGASRYAVSRKNSLENGLSLASSGGFETLASLITPFSAIILSYRIQGVHVSKDAVDVGKDWIVSYGGPCSYGRNRWGKWRAMFQPFANGSLGSLANGVVPE